MKIVDIVDKEIERLEAFVDEQRAKWEGFEEGEGEGFSLWDPPCDVFGNGTEYGQWLEAKESLRFLKRLRGDN